MKKKFLIIVFFIFKYGEAFTQAEEEWMRRYNGSSGSYDIVSKMLIDKHNNVLAFGSSNETGSLLNFLIPFIELSLGILYLLNQLPVFTNLATIIVMGISSIGVIQSIMNKRKIQCACLGTVFNLPMSTITLVEDLLMVVMADAMLIYIGI